MIFGKWRRRLNIVGSVSYTHLDLADLVNVRRETIGNLENGKYNPSLKLAMDIAKIFETTVEDLFSFTDVE